MSASDPPGPDTWGTSPGTETRTAMTLPGERASTSPLQAGTSIGRFLLLERIGQGGMGSVWAAYDADLDRKVALKLVHPDLVADEDARTRMVREGQALARLTHPNVVAVHEVGVHGDNVYLAMEYVEGETLKAWLARHPPGDEGRLAAMLAIMEQAGRGLAAAHEAGMVHRDFKPANVIVGTDGRVRVVDFGLARAQEAAKLDGVGDGLEKLVATFRGEPMRSTDGSRVALHDSVTQTGAFVGTPGYMSPEQFEGRKIDARSDVFSFATVLYEATYGRSPWPAETVAAIYAQMLEGPSEPEESADVPAWLASAIRRGLAPRPAERHATLAELLASIVPPRARRSRRKLALLATGVGIGALASTWLARPEPVVDACAGQADRVAAVWNPAVRERIATAFSATALAYADASLAAVAAELDAYASEWSLAADSACRSAPEQLGCLDSQLAELEHLVGLYTDADPATVERALDAANGLTPISWCSRASTIGSRDHERIGSMLAELASARTLARLGRNDDSATLAAAVADTAHRLGLPAIRARALLQLGTLGIDERADQHLEDAFWLALGDRDDETAAEAAIARLRRTHEIESASVWRRHATVLFMRNDFAADLHASLWNALGFAANRRGEHDLAIEYHEAALRAFAAVPGGSALDALSAELGLAMAYRQRGKHVESNAVLQQTLERVHARLGPDHPLVASIHHDIGLNDTARGSYASAEREIREALAIRERSSEPSDAALIATRRTLGECLVHSGRFEEGLGVLDAALAALPRPLAGTTATDLVLAIGTAHLVTGDAERAMPYLEQAYALTVDHRGADASAATVVLNRLTAASAALGHIDAAISFAHKERAIMAATGNELGTALAYANLAVLESNRGRHAEAIALCRSALGLYEIALPAGDARLAFPLRVSALSLLALGRPDEAVAPLERALLLHAPNSYDAGERPKTLLALARALWSSGRDRERARRLALEARTTLVDSDRAHTVEFREVSEWLERHADSR